MVCSQAGHLKLRESPLETQHAFYEWMISLERRGKSRMVEGLANMEGRKYCKSDITQFLVAPLYEAVRYHANSEFGDILRQLIYDVYVEFLL